MSDENKKEIELGSQQALEDLHITAAGKPYFIHGFHRHFFEQLQKLPISARIELMNLKTKDMQDYVTAKKRTARAKVDYLLSLRWYWKDSGDEVEFHIDTIPGVHYSIAEIKSKHRSIETLNQVIEFFEGDDREVYNKP
jgi:hypothetical protein